MKTTNRQPDFSTMKVFCSSLIALAIILGAVLHLIFNPAPRSISQNTLHDAKSESFARIPEKIDLESDVDIPPADDDSIEVSMNSAEDESAEELSDSQVANADEVSEELKREQFPFQNLFGLPVGSEELKGALVIGGGGKLSEEIYQEFIRLAGGKKAKIVLIPSAYPYRDLEHIQRNLGGWRSYEFESLEYLHTDDPNDADRDDFCKPLETATGVWFGGGSQGRLAHRYANRKVEKMLHEVVARGGVVGGTSAGASILSQLMIRDGSYSSARTDRGLGLCERLVVDQHFSQRGRFPRLIGVLEDNLGKVGLGIDERTCVVIKGDEVSAIGEGFANLFVGPSQQGEGTSIFRIKGGQTVHGNQIVRKESSSSGNNTTLRKP